jgi:hypothetical protein
MPHRCEAVLERAARLGWAARTDRDGWVLSRGADLLRLSDIYKAYAFDAETWHIDPSDLALNLSEYAMKETK